MSIKLVLTNVLTILEKISIIIFVKYKICVHTTKAHMRGEKI